jgi:hypothetical protein
MKKFLLTIIFLICSLICVNANNATSLDNNINNNIQEVIINVPSYVRIYEGEEFGINIRTFNKDLYKHIKYEIKNDKLYIDFKNHILREDDIIVPEDIRINIQAPNNIKKIRTNSYLLVAKINKNTNATNNGKN